RFLMTFPTHSFSNIYPPFIPLVGSILDDYGDYTHEPPFYTSLVLVHLEEE
ncbi:Hypothetical protein FKW44_021581, partial [Caligus rogercresseyi]